jgi:predicted RNA polymerase sigma factor
VNDAAHRAAETAARHSYGRLVAYLSARSRDIAAAEDALSEAFAASLVAWPRSGVPDSPEAWLLTAARRSLMHGARHRGVRAAARPTLLMMAEPMQTPAAEDIPDDRLKLMFVCAHPAIDPASRTPLMLQTVLGLDARRIAAAFLVAPAAMSQRLVRAKTKIRDAGIAFEVPEPRELPGRLDAVLQAVYAAYGTGWDDIDGADASGGDLVREAIWLGRMLVGLLPAEPEPVGLLALMLHSEARRAARRDAGRFVPLSEQDPSRWDTGMIIEAERLLEAAARLQRIGRFQLEAAIQSVHAQRAVTGVTRWDDIVRLHDGLIAMAPTVGAHVARAAALAQAQGAGPGLAALDGLSGESLDGYQPAYALRGHLLQRLGRRSEAAAAFDRAIGLSESPAVRAFLLEKRNLAS